MDVLAVSSFRSNEIKEPLERTEADCRFIDIDPSNGPISRAITTFLEIRRAVRERRPDVVLLDAYEVIGFVTVLLAWWYRVPILCRLIGDWWRAYATEKIPAAKRDGALLRLVEFYLSRLLNTVIDANTDGYVVVSSALKDTVVERTSCPAERVAVVPVPTDLELQDRGSESKLREHLSVEEPTIVLTVTNLLYRGKFDGVRTVIDELRPVLAANGDLEYVILGGGTYHSALLDYVDETVTDPDVRERIYAPGFVEYVDDALAAADVFVYVSHLDGYPNAVLEAQTANVPVVANGACGMVDQIEHAESGYLVHPNESGAIQDRVRRLLESPAERARISENAYQRVLADNTPESVGRRLEASLRQILEEIEQDEN